MIEELKKKIDEFVERATKGDSDRQRFKEPVKQYLFKYYLLRYAIENSSSLDELENKINESAQFLEKRIAHIREFLNQHASATKKRVYQETQRTNQAFGAGVERSTENYLDVIPNDLGSPEWRDEVRNLSKELIQLQESVSNTLAFVEFFKVEFPVRILNDIAKKYEEFKSIRKRQKQKQRLYQFILAVVVFGFAISFLASNLLKLMLQNKLLLIVGAICTFGIAILKEYVISPWVRKKRLELQRKHLLLCLREFREAELSLLLHAPQDYVLDKLV